MLIRPQFGYIPNPKRSDRLISKMPYNLYGNYAKDYKEKDTFLYKAMMKALPNYKRGAQAIGSCTGWAWAFCTLCRSAIESLVYGEGESVHGRISEASIYGFSRVEVEGKSFAGWGDGSYGAACAEAVRKFGCLYYDDYSSISNNKYADHRTYSGDREKNFGAYGIPNELETTAKKFTIKTASLVTNFDQLASAMVNNLSPVPVCSNQGFTMTRDADGFCKASGTWNHAMSLIGVRFGRRPGALCVNSWGDSNDGSHYPLDIPEAIKKCSFWIDANIVDRMLRQEDSFAISGFNGWSITTPPDFSYF